MIYDIHVYIYIYMKDYCIYTYMKDYCILYVYIYTRRLDETVRRTHPIKASRNALRTASRKASTATAKRTGATVGRGAPKCVKMNVMMNVTNS